MVVRDLPTGKVAYVRADGGDDEVNRLPKIRAVVASA